MPALLVNMSTCYTNFKLVSCLCQISSVKKASYVSLNKHHRALYAQKENLNFGTFWEKILAKIG